MSFSELNLPAFAFLDGTGAAGAYTYPMASEQPVIDVSSWDEAGGGYDVTFDIGAFTGGSGMKEITDVHASIVFTVD